MSELNRTWVHPNAISYESKGVEQPLHYFRRWQHLNFILDSYTIKRWIFSQDIQLSDIQFDLAMRKLTRSAFDALSEAEQEALRSHQFKIIKKAAETEGAAIAGWGRLDKDRIRAFSVMGKLEAHATHEAEYDKTFEAAKISIRSSEKAYVGSMWLETAELRKFGTDDSDPDDDFLSIELHVKASQLLRVIEDLSSMPDKPALEVRVQGLLFRDEVEASLSEPWHPHEFCFIHEEFAPVILNNLTYPLLGRHKMPIDEEEDVTTTSLLTRLAPTRIAQAPMDKVAKQMRGIKRALWILAGVLFLAALIVAS